MTAAPPEYPDKAWVTEVCRIGQGKACCRYLTMSPGGWSCEKHEPELSAFLDHRVANNTITAQGDNCAGLKSRKPP